MGLLFSDEGSLDVRARQEDALFHRMGCKACPLRETQPGRMLATGSPHPKVLIIGEAPGQQEQKQGVQFVGDSGQLIRPRIPKKWLPHIRWTNSVQCRPPRNRTPERIEVECCRPRWSTDIEQTKPEAIFGFGNVPLNALTGFSGITLWRGRRMPIRVGTHVCWYYPMAHPSFLLRQRRADARDAGGTFIGSEDERMFCFDLKNAFLDVEEGLPTPVVHDEAQARAGVEIITAPGAEGVRLIKEALEWAALQPSIGVDYETNCLRPYLNGAKILTAAVGTLKRAVAFPLRHRQAQFDTHHLEQIEGLWGDFLRNSGKKYVHNLAFEMEWTGFMFGEDLLRASRWEDTSSQAAVIDERKGKNKPGCFSLEFLIQQYFGFNLKKLSNVDRKDLDAAALPTVLSYNAMDAKYHWGLGRKQEKIIAGLGLELVYELSVRRVPTVVLSQLRGVAVDQKEVTRLQKKYGARVKKILAEIQKVDVVQTFGDVKGRDYVPTSNPDTIEIFTKFLKRRECTVVDKFSKKPKLSCDESVLEKIDHPLAPLLISLRKAARNKSTYIDVLAPDTENSALMPDGLIHCVYNTYWAETGRLSCVRKGTQVQVVGGVKAIEDIKIGDLVYSFDRKKRLRLRKVKNTWYRGVKPIVRLHWVGQGGRTSGYLDVTEDHRVRLVNGKYQEARFFRGGKASFRFRPGLNGGEHVLAVHRAVKGGRNYLYATGEGGLKEARFVFEELNGWSPEHVHHDDENPTNDQPYNLVGMTHSAHTRLHSKKAMSIPGEGRRRMLKRSPEVVERVQKAVVEGGRRRAEKRFTKVAVLAALKKGKGVKGAAVILDCDRGCIDWRIEQWRLGDWDGRKLRPTRPGQRKKRGPYKGHTKYVGKYRSPYNHVIVKVERLKGNFPVYDLEVEGTNNFIANEICVHNCEQPNLQNFPKRDGEAQEVRRQMAALPGEMFLSLDLGQIEARVIAMFTKDKAYCKALWENYDVHMEWAERIARAYPDRIGGKKMLTNKKVMKDFRTDIKNQWTFPLFFGAQLSSAAGYLNIPENKLRPEYNAFWRQFSGVKDWQEEQLKFYREYGYVECLTGRRRHGPLSENKVYNSPVQGTAAELIMDRMCYMSELGDPELQPELQIHDDLSFLRVKENRADQVAEKILDVMLDLKHFDWINVPITVELAAGKNWAPYEEKNNPEGLKAIGTFSSDSWFK